MNSFESGELLRNEVGEKIDHEIAWLQLSLEEAVDVMEGNLDGFTRPEFISTLLNHIDEIHGYWQLAGFVPVGENSASVLDKMVTFFEEVDKQFHALRNELIEYQLGKRNHTNFDEHAKDVLKRLKAYVDCSQKVFRNYHQFTHGSVGEHAADIDYGRSQYFVLQKAVALYYKNVIVEVLQKDSEYVFVAYDTEKDKLLRRVRMQHTSGGEMQQEIDEYVDKALFYN